MLAHRSLLTHTVDLHLMLAQKLLNIYYTTLKDPF